MIEVPNTEQMEAFLDMVEVEQLRRASDDTVRGVSEVAFCTVCGEEHDGGDHRLTAGFPCAACGEEAVYPVTDLLAYCEQLGVL
jgi:hypothetical protein